MTPALPARAALLEPLAEPDRAETVLRTARQAWVEWRRTPLIERAASLRELASAVDDAAEELARLNTSDTGRIFADALSGVRSGAEALRRYAELSLLRSAPSVAGVVSGLDFTVFEPRGVVLGITSWDDPVATACAIAGAGLAAGNVVVLKPSERCPRLGSRLGQIFDTVTPPGVLTTVQGGTELEDALARDRHVDAVVHPGMTGRGAALVDRGVDVDWAASCVAEAAFRHAGQLRSAAGRVFVMDDVEEPFLAALAEEAAAWADPRRIGPLVDEQARSAVHAGVSASVEEGAFVLAGGKVPAGPGAYYPPTVLAGASPLMPIMRDVVRGPVAAVMRVHSFEEALAEAAEPPAGPTAIVLTRDIGHAQLAAAELPVSTVVINGVVSAANASNAPQNGMPDGFGPSLLDELSRPKAVHLESPVTARARRH